MAKSPQWKVYMDGQYIAGFKYLLHAGILVSTLGQCGALVQVKRNHTELVYTENVDGCCAGSFDTLEAVVLGDSWNG